MNNPYSQHQPHYGENQRGGYGRNRNDRWSSDDSRGARPNWSEDASGQGRSPWGEDEYSSQNRSARNSNSFSDGGQEWQGRGGRVQSDEYGYTNQDRQGERNWADSYSDDYAMPQQDYALGEAPSRSRSYSDNGRGSLSRNDGDFSRYGRQGEPSQSPAYERYGQQSLPPSRSGYRQQAGQRNQGGQQEWGGQRDWGSHQNWGARGAAAQGAFSQALHYGPQGGSYGQQTFDYGQQEVQYGRDSKQSGARGAFGLQEKSHRGKGPKGYVRTDERIREEICEMLSDDPRIDASDIAVEVRGGVVTLEGTVNDRSQKHRVEDIADSCSGVKDVHNSLRVSNQRAVAAQGSTGAASATLNSSTSSPGSSTGATTAGQSGSSGQGATQASSSTSTQTRQ